MFALSEGTSVPISFAGSAPGIDIAESLSDDLEARLLAVFFLPAFFGAAFLATFFLRLFLGWPF